MFTFTLKIALRPYRAYFMLIFILARSVEITKGDGEVTGGFEAVQKAAGRGG